MKQRLLAIGWMCAGVLMLPAMALAASGDPADIVDARLEGYPTNVTLDAHSVALMWLLVIVLAILGLGVLFKNAKRSHLD